MYLSKILNCGPIIDTENSKERSRVDACLQMFSESCEYILVEVSLVHPVFKMTDSRIKPWLLTSCVTLDALFVWFTFLSH